MKKALKILSLIFAIVGLAILLADLLTFWRYGYHVNEVAGFTERGDPIDWPTGEIPLLFQIPVWVYGVGIWVFAAVVFAVSTVVRKPYFGRVWRGAE